jgi:Chaperone of endosialidase
MSTTIDPKTPQGPIPAIGVPNSQDYPRLVFTSPYFETVPLAELIEPAVIEAVESALPGLVPPFVSDAANAAVAQQAVMLTGSTMSGPLFLNPVLPVQPSQAASMAYVDLMISTAGVPEVPPTPIGQTWARQTGQWVPFDPQGGLFLALTGGTMQGQINMSGNGITNLPALPQMPNGAAPAEWVLNQIAAHSLYQGTWVPETNTPDLTLPGNNQNGFTWIAVTASTSGVVITFPIPGLQGLTVYNGDNIIFSAIAGQFQIVRSGGLSLAEAEALFLPFTGGQMSGPLMLNANATSAMQATTLQQVQALAAFPESPSDGQLYGRQGLTQSWVPVLPLGGGVLSGPLTLAANAVQPLNAVPLQQLNSTLGAYVPLAGNATINGPLTMSGAGASLTLNGNAAANLQPVPLQQLTSTLGSYATTAYVSGGYLPLSGGTLTGGLITTALSTGTNVGVRSGTNFVAFDAPGTTPTAMLDYWVGTVAQGNVVVSFEYPAQSLFPISSLAMSSTGPTIEAWYSGGPDIVEWTVNWSDRRLKRNIVPCEIDALASVDQVPVWSVDFKAPLPDAPVQRWAASLIADEVAAVLPFAVVPAKENGYALLNPQHLIATLWRAVQQLSERLAVLEAA